MNIAKMFVTVSIIGALVSSCGGGGGGGSGNSHSSSSVPLAADTVAPSLIQITAVPSVSADTTPTYIFSANEAGTITYSGACTSSTSSAMSGNNTIVFDTLSPNLYNSCTIKVTDISGNASSTLTIPAFTVVASGTVSGSVLNNATGAPIEGASVALGEQSATTDAEGKYRITEVAVTDHAVVNISKDNFAQGSKITAVFANEISRTDAFLLPVAYSKVIDDLSLATIVAVPNSSARVSLPANSIKTVNNTSPSGAVTISVTPIDPSSNPQIMPGDFSTDGNGQIESFGALDVNLRDATGASLNLAAGSSATLRIPVSAANQGNLDLANTMPMWHYDTVGGRWVSQGTLTLGGIAPGRYYEGQVTHFSTWNADLLYESTCVTGVVVDMDGNRVKNARVMAEGLNYSASSAIYTAEDGTFNLKVKPSAKVVVTARTAIGNSNSLVVESGLAGTDCTTISESLVIGKASGSAKITLTWFENPADLDSHLRGPILGSSERFHIYYVNPDSGNAFLDVDDTSSFGPEIITINGFNPGVYRYSVVHFSGEGSIPESPARVELTLNGWTRVFRPPTPTAVLGVDSVWVVMELKVDNAGAITVEPINTYESVLDTEAQGSSATIMNKPTMLNSRKVKVK